MTDFVFTDDESSRTTAEIPRLRYPFEMQILDRGPAVVEQGSVHDVAQCVYSVLGTELGERQELPDFGIEDPTFLLGGADVEEIREVVEEWEPRADTSLTDAQWTGVIQEVRVRVGV